MLKGRAIPTGNGAFLWSARSAKEFGGVEPREEMPGASLVSNKNRERELGLDRRETG